MKALIRRVQLGEPDAYAAVIERFQDMAVGYGYSILGDLQLAEDAAQEAFVYAYYDLPQLREPAAFPGWFRRIVFTQIHRLQRAQKVRTMPLEQLAETASTDRTPADLIETNEIRQEVAAAIATLPEHQRTVVMLFYINEYSQKEISAFLGIPVATVKTRLHAARKRLKARMIHTLQTYLADHRPSQNQTFMKEMTMNLALAKVLSAGIAGCEVQLIETGEVLETRYSLQMQDYIKVRPEQLVVIDRQATPARTLFRCYLCQVTAINGDAITVELLRSDGDRGQGRQIEATIAEGLDLTLNVGDDVYGYSTIFGRAINGRPAEPQQLLAAVSPAFEKIYSGDTFQLDPQSAAALTNRGNVHFDDGAYEQAIALYNQALVANPNYIVAHTNRGHAYKAKGEMVQAKADYERVIALLEQPASDILPNNHPTWRSAEAADAVQNSIQTRLQQAKGNLAQLEN